MQIDKNLIENFFAGKCSKEEAIAVKRFFQDPENFNKYWNETEWQKIIAQPEFDKDVSKQMNVKILDQIFEKQARRSANIRILSYSALFLLMVSSVFLFYYPKYMPSDKSQANKTVLKVPEQLTVLKNKSGKTETYNLPDGSVVEIEPNSQISYLPFTGNKREIFLKGEALFRVHKDKERPFTVYASDLATTAIGTVFRIYAHQQSLFTRVNLIAGKVVIKPQNKLLSAGIKTVYLTPGKSFSVNKTSYATRVSNIEQRDEINAFDPAGVNGSTTITTEAIVFDNQSLTNVFEVLSRELNLKIDYQKNSIRKKVFTGQYEFKSDDPVEFLNMVATLNNLKLFKTRIGYTIKRELHE